MDTLSLIMIIVPILLILIYIVSKRSAGRSGNSSAILDEKRSDQFEGHSGDPLKAMASNEDTLFAGQLDDPIEALTSNVRLRDVDRRIKNHFPVEKHAEVVDVLSKCTTANKATVYSIILDEADGDVDKIREYVKIANRVGDYRDLALALISLRSK
jgi:hypothetical protein